MTAHEGAAEKNCVHLSYLDHFGPSNRKNLELGSFVVILKVQVKYSAVSERTLNNIQQTIQHAQQLSTFCQALQTRTRRQS